MKEWLMSDLDVLLKVFISVILVFSLLVIWVRISGLRSFAKMSSIDFASTIAIGSVLASTILNESPSVLKGGLAIGFILLFQTIFSKLTLKYGWFDTLVSNRPLLLMKGENILYDNLHATNMSEEDLMAKLREANVIELSEVKAVILETTGDVSVLHSGTDKKLDELLLKNILTKL
ncbi:hypothetical protein LCGC14_0666010 [marine sediment metagenome]|uniref:DUF421 domain-containing protein n=2 Tax=root TaxID=1 RepID=A0A831VVY7_9FLAO|nr:DUF421 domain-containing protein [Pricia sp.]HEA21844.1 DUF421 domain-containing protein [Pricia antarctica]